MLPIDRFLTFIEQNQLFETSERVLLAVSGGRDSVLMTHLFNAAKMNFGIAHCNFSLRGSESDGDEAFVRDLAERMDVPFHLVRFDTEVYSKQNAVSIQMAARHLRYSWFDKIRAQSGYEYVAVAHHQSDATETILLNLIRGTGIAGLHGILPKRARIIRPMLFLSSAEVTTVVEQNEIQFREDSSNVSVKYARNKIRHQVIPVLKELNRDLDETFAANGRRFAELEDFLNVQIGQLRNELFTGMPEGVISINLPQLKTLHPRLLLLYELFKPFGFQEPVLTDLISNWDGQPGKVFESESHQLLLDRGRLILRKKGSGSDQSDQASAGLSEGINISENDWHIYLKQGILKIGIRDSSDITFNPDPRFAYFDHKLLQFPLKLRQWTKGDFFYPFGMKGKKKLSDFFTSLKLSRYSKESVPVLENRNGDILWVVGYRSDNRYKISAQSKKVFILEYINYEQ